MLSSTVADGLHSVVRASPRENRLHSECFDFQISPYFLYLTLNGKALFVSALLTVSKSHRIRCDCSAGVQMH